MPQRQHPLLFHTGNHVASAAHGIPVRFRPLFGLSTFTDQVASCAYTDSEQRQAGNQCDGQDPGSDAEAHFQHRGNITGRISYVYFGLENPILPDSAGPLGV